MVFLVLFWVILVLVALGVFFYRTHPLFFPGSLGVLLVLIALLGWKVYPPG